MGETAGFKEWLANSSLTRNKILLSSIFLSYFSIQ